MPVDKVSLPVTPPIRILVVDDSAVIRGLITRWLGESGGFEVVGSAGNGRVAVESVERLKPDIVLLDLEMPEMDGLTALPLLLKVQPSAKIIVISTLTQRNAEISLKCLSLGAVDYLPKPESSRVAGALADFQHDLVQKLRALGATKTRHVKPPAAPPASQSAPLKMPPVRPKCLVIGASTGGPRAIERVLSDLGDAAASLPILIVQHMPPMFTAVFAEHLQSLLSLPAREGRDGDALSPGTILVAPGGRHMGLAVINGKPVIRLDDGAPENFCRPAVDVLFRDAAAVFGASALAIILTGMGSDGTHGARALAQSGSTILAQDEMTSIVWGMPGSVSRAGLARETLPLEALGPLVKSIIKKPV
ncbi:protein-glutamate methylesterase/protein-glutamine glutaminase [Microvirga brassicacearum]|nr:chemotaxis response regulator protein-glutamate methylesterase [Microvirga brassicacearum]